jgi:hypothetical protein
MDTKKFAFSGDFGSTGRSTLRGGGLPGSLPSYLETFGSKTHHDFSIESIQAHLKQPRMMDLGQWDTVVCGYYDDICDYMEKVFELYRYHPSRVASIDASVRHAMDRPGRDLERLLPHAESENIYKIKSAINSIIVTVEHSMSNHPPEDLECLKIQMSLGSNATNFGRVEKIHELRAFRVRDLKAYGTICIASHSDDAKKALRKLKGSHLSVGYECKPLADWLTEDGAWQDKVTADRKAAGTCTMCGQTLGAMQRLFGAIKHKECREFVE